MKEVLHTIQSWVMLACFLSLAAVFILSISPKISSWIRKIVSGPFVLVVLSFGLVMYGGAKHRSVLYPYTDPTQVYLRDNGSYVDSDTSMVHIDFTRIIAPDSANVFVDRIQDGDESGVWTTEIQTTFGSLQLPYDFYFENATNYRWMVYTDWTPGPSVQTNGVWHANWALDRKARRFIIPIRTAVRVDGKTIATPKSKKDSGNEDE